VPEATIGDLRALLMKKPPKEPKNSAEQKANHQAGHEGEVEADSVSFIADVTRQAPQPRKSRARNPDQPNQGRHQTGDEKDPTEANVVIHPMFLLEEPRCPIESSQYHFSEMPKGDECPRRWHAFDLPGYLK
jgi:hypothetical protein